MNGRHVELDSKGRPWILNKRFGKLTVIQFIEIDDKNNDHWVVKCDCGNKKNMLGYSIRNMARASCGVCKKIEETKPSIFNKITNIFQLKVANV
jgi:hypothetical protein